MEEADPHHSPRLTMTNEGGDVGSFVAVTVYPSRDPVLQHEAEARSHRASVRTFSQFSMRIASRRRREIPRVTRSYQAPVVSEASAKRIGTRRCRAQRSYFIYHYHLQEERYE